MRALLFIAALLIAGYLFVQSSGPIAEASAVYAEPPVAESAGSIEVVSLQCTAKTSHTSIEATIRNTGSSTIKFPSLFVRVLGVVEEGIASPMTLPSGALGTVSMTGPNPGQSRGSSIPCEVVAAQNQRGQSIL